MYSDIYPFNTFYVRYSKCNKSTQLEKLWEFNYCDRSEPKKFGNIGTFPPFLGRNGRIIYFLSRTGQIIYFQHFQGQNIYFQTVPAPPPLRIKQNRSTEGWSSSIVAEFFWGIHRLSNELALKNLQPLKRFCSNLHLYCVMSMSVSGRMLI